MAEQLYQSLLPSIEHFHQPGYWLAFFAALLETALIIGLLLPGSSLLLLLGALAAGGQLDFAGVLWFGIAGAVLGDNLNYWLGRRYGHRWTRNGTWLLKLAHFEQTRRFFDSHGAKSVFLGRFIPGIKEIAPFVAGTVGIRRHLFLFWNTLGGIGWGLQWIGGGYLFGQSLKLAQGWMSFAGMAVLCLLLLWGLLWLLKRALMRHGPRTWLLLKSLWHSVLRALATTPWIHRFMQRHPLPVRFLAARIDRSHFYGLPLTLLVLTFAYVLALFGGIVEDLVTSDTIIALDQSTAQLVARFRPPQVIAPFVWITALGVAKVIAPLLAITALILWLMQRIWLIFPLLVSSLGATAFSTLGKFTFQRPRPAEAVLLEQSYSFPSGHATIAVAFYGFLAYVLIRSSASWQRQINWLFLAVILILLIGLSRVVVGVHYLSDVWAGYLVGTLWLIVGISLSEWLTSAGRLQWPDRLPLQQRWWLAGLVALGLGWYLLFTVNWQPPRYVAPAEQVVVLDRSVDAYLTGKQAAFTETLLGDPDQPLGFAIMAADADSLLAALHQAGWRASDKLTPQSMMHLLTQGMDYATAPIAPSFWQGRINDLALQKVMPIGAKQVNNTVRLWQTPYRSTDGHIFIGVARAYDAMQWRLFRRISPDIDAATRTFVTSLQDNRLLQHSCEVPLVTPMTGNFLLGGDFFTQGKLWLLDTLGRSGTGLQCEKRQNRPD